MATYESINSQSMLTSGSTSSRVSTSGSTSSRPHCGDESALRICKLPGGQFRIHSLSMGCEQFAAQSMLGLLAPRRQLWRCLAPLLNLHKVEKFQLKANASGANPRGQQSANRTWAWAVTLTLLLHYRNAGGSQLILA